MGAADGKRAAVADALGAASARVAADRAEPEQVPMFPVPTRFHGDRAAALNAAIAHRRGQVGRPKGSKNRASAELREWLLARGVDPLQQLMEWAMHTPTSLAAELGCTRAEAFDRLVRLWEACAPFFHARLAQVDGQGAPVVPSLNVQIGAGHHGGARPPPWEYMRQQIEEKQGVTLDVPAVSHADVSHEGDK